jgi:hypothetical protein
MANPMWDNTMWIRYSRGISGAGLYVTIVDHLGVVFWLNEFEE